MPGLGSARDDEQFIRAAAERTVADLAAHGIAAHIVGRAPPQPVSE